MKQWISDNLEAAWRAKWWCLLGVLCYSVPMAYSYKKNGEWHPVEWAVVAIYSFLLCVNHDSLVRDVRRERRDAWEAKEMREEERQRHSLDDWFHSSYGFDPKEWGADGPS